VPLHLERDGASHQRANLLKEGPRLADAGGGVKVSSGKLGSLGGQGFPLLGALGQQLLERVLVRDPVRASPGAGRRSRTADRRIRMAGPFARS
jgi:hypothetical protein